MDLEPAAQWSVCGLGAKTWVLWLTLPGRLVHSKHRQYNHHVSHIPRVTSDVTDGFTRIDVAAVKNWPGQRFNRRSRLFMNHADAKDRGGDAVGFAFSAKPASR